MSGFLNKPWSTVSSRQRRSYVNSYYFLAFFQCSHLSISIQIWLRNWRTCFLWTVCGKRTTVTDSSPSSLPSLLAKIQDPPQASKLWEIGWRQSGPSLLLWLLSSQQVASLYRPVSQRNPASPEVIITKSLQYGTSIATPMCRPFGAVAEDGVVQPTAILRTTADRPTLKLNRSSSTNAHQFWRRLRLSRFSRMRCVWFRMTTRGYPIFANREARGFLRC